MDDKPCYGNHGKKSFITRAGDSASVGNCRRCSSAKWCKDAGDIKPEDHVELDKVAFSEQCATQPDFTSEPADDCIKCASAMAKCVRELLALEKQSPLRFHVIMAKLSNPEMAYSQIAERFGIQKQLVQYHLRVAIGIFPELGRAILINRKYNPGKPGIFKPCGSRITLKLTVWKRWADKTPFLPGFG
jgi:hypothetical protein